jgi:hypothetical protein
MLHSVVIAVAVLLGTRGVAGTKDEESLRFINAAIKANAGRENLSKFTTGHGKGEGIAFLEDGSSHPMVEESWNVPGKYRSETRIYSEERNSGELIFSEVSVVNGNVGWISINGVTRKVNKQEAAALPFAHRLCRWNLLYPLIEEKDVSLNYLGEIQLGETRVVRIRASVDNSINEHCEFHFDKSSYFLVRTRCPFVDPDKGTEIVEIEEEYGQHKKISGVSIAFEHSLRVGGKLRHKTKTIEFQLLDKVDDRLFQKPE